MSTTCSTKRGRTDLDLEEPFSDSLPSPSLKAQRLSGQDAESSTSGSGSLLCTLPPTCHPPHNYPTPLANAQELEGHYAKYHAFVCEDEYCGAVFPDSRLLELHQTECHDPIAAERKARGEKIFACHIDTCPKLFMTPKARRLHLIQAHAFPKEYFFAVTNKGVGGLLKKWGEGASLIRGSWKAREEQNECDSDEDILDEDAESLESTREMLSQETDDARALNSGESHTTQLNVDALASSMDSLTLIPNTIRFGRGAKNFRSPRGYQRGGGSRGARNFIPLSHVGGQQIEYTQSFQATSTRTDGSSEVQNGLHGSSFTPKHQFARAKGYRGGQGRGGNMNRGMG